jgi:hypothetical protein
MEIHAKRGDRVRFLGASDCQVTYYANDDPRTVLKAGDIYTVHHTSVCNWHTDVYLSGFPGKRFNSVCFEDVEEPRCSRAPDPAFIEAARRRFDPETPAEREAFWEKIGAVREGK